MNTIRLPILWERLQPTARGKLDPTQLALLQQAVARAKAAGMYLVIDLHNYAKYYGYKIGSPEVPVSTFTDVWRRLALTFKSDNAVMFGLMNEPNNISASEWAGAAQAAIDAIRKTGANNLILVPGALWTGAHSWYSPRPMATQRHRVGVHLRSAQSLRFRGASVSGRRFQRHQHHLCQRHDRRRSLA